jgi:hypothetical protein
MNLPTGSGSPRRTHPGAHRILTDVLDGQLRKAQPRAQTVDVVTMRTIVRRLAVVSAIGWAIAVGLVAHSTHIGDAWAVQQLLMGLVVGASAAGTVSAVIAASLPRSSTAWLLGYRAALRDHAEQADPRRHLRRVD